LWYIFLKYFLQQSKINQVTENKSLQISSRYFFNFLIFLDKTDGKSIKKWKAKSFHFKHIIRGTCSVPQLGGGKNKKKLKIYPNFVRALLSKFL